MSRTLTIRAIDLFCGVGGLTHGLAQAGIEVVAGIDIDPACKYPYEANNQAEFIEGDVNDSSPKQRKGKRDDRPCCRDRGTRRGKNPYRVGP